MLFKNTYERFGIIAILLHWIMAILIIGMLILGIYMTDLPKSLLKLKYYGWHKEFGLLVLALVIIRLSWRLLNVTPALSLPLWEKLGAHASHYALYIFMFAMPLTGWIMTSAAGLPPSFFGLFVLPPITQPNQEVRELFQQIHGWLAYALIAFITLHVLAALKHHFINKDNILRRILSP